MRRRQLLKMMSTIAAGGLLPGSLVSRASADFGMPARPILVQVMLLGGPDFRHLFPPAPDPQSGSFGDAFWKVRFRAYGIDGAQIELVRRPAGARAQCRRHPEPGP